MVKKALGIMVAAGAVMTAVLFGAGTASAEDTFRVVPAAADMGVLASPKCSGTVAHGKILYQVCVRYNCDNDSCFHRGYLGLINTATSARTVTWDLDWSALHLPNWYHDDTGVVTLAAGQQQTIFSDYTVESSPCGFTAQRRLSVGYDSSGMSTPVQVADYLACV